MTKLEQKLIEALKRRLQRLAALLPVLRQVAERYRALGGVTQETLERLFPELAALVAAIEAQLQETECERRSLPMR